MRALILAAGAAVALAACSGGNEAQDDNALAVENLEVGNVIMNDPAAMNGTAMDANMVGTTTDVVANDLTTNDADTNLANGL